MIPATQSTAPRRLFAAHHEESQIALDVRSTRLALARALTTHPALPRAPARELNMSDEVAPASSVGVNHAVAHSSPLDSESLHAIAGAFMPSGDATMVLMALEAQVDSGRSTSERRQVVQQQRRTTRASEEQKEARARAAAAHRKARRWLRSAPRWLKRMVKVIITAASIAAAACTGGAALGLAIAGAVLLHGADRIANIAVALGMSEKGAKWLGFACSLAGAALSGGSSLVNGAAAAAGSAVSAASHVIETVRTVTSAVLAAMQVSEATRAVGAAVYSRRETDATLDAEHFGLDVDSAASALADITDAMRTRMQAFSNISSRLSNMAELQRNRDDAIVAQFGR